MNRTLYFNYIDEKLSVLAERIKRRGKLNILDYHIHSEGFYENLLNVLFDWSLKNENPFKQNVEAIDLIDNTINKIVAQVSATATKEKIESSLEKDLIQTKKNYTFKFISIAKDATDLRKKVFKNPHGINFNPKTDIIDIQSVLNYVLSLNPDKQKNVYNVVKAELGGDTDIVKLDSNLATVINILSKEDWNNNEDTEHVKEFEIERKIEHNNLVRASYVINDYKIHYNRVNKKYNEYDEQGLNKSLTVLSTIRHIFIKNVGSISDDDLFFKVIDSVIEKVTESKNFIEIPIDELELCVNILVVDAFIRCKIFKNPENYKYATS